MKRFMLGIGALALISTIIYAAGVSQITAASYNSKISGNDYTAHCTNGSYGSIEAQENGMVCASGNGKSSKCSYDWSVSSAASYICQ